MLNRVFKTILILSICLGITLPSNASSTKVSDGSVFITKSEFSSKLNSLSNRLSAVENSIDSKINSLVSSYLTRNGIWNGAKQHVQNDLGTTPNSNESLRVFTNITKSGLMLVTYYIDIDYLVGIVHGAHNKSAFSEQAGMGSPVVYTLTLKVSLYNATTNQNYQASTIMYCLTGEYDNGNATSFCLKLKNKPSGLFCFFVEKDDNINYKLTTNLDARMDWWSMKLVSPVSGNQKNFSGKAIQQNSSTYGNWITGSYYTMKFGIVGTDVEVW